MNYILFCIFLSMFGGLIKGVITIQEVKRNPLLGIPESKNLFSFLFTDRH